MLAGGGCAEVSGGWQRSPEPRHPDEAELRHPRDPGARHPLDHGPRHPGNAAHEDSAAWADTEHGCNREERLVIMREREEVCRLRRALHTEQLAVTIMRGWLPVS